MATADVGARMNQVDMQMDLIDENVLRLKTTLSEVQDLDYTEAVTRMNKQMMALQASMSSFSKISQLNLFDYIR
jgi:flagellar hook-associated protein 3 FlgL